MFLNSMNIHYKINPLETSSTTNANKKNQVTVLKWLYILCKIN